MISNLPLELVRELRPGWKMRERQGGSEWADRERSLSREESPAPGPWRSVPWQKELLDALADPLVTFLVILKAAQMGVSELVRCAIGRWSLLDPGDVLWVMTTQDAAESAMRKLRLMFASTPALRHLVSDRPGDSRLLQMRLSNGMKITIGWAGSPQSLASDPQRYVILDEAAKYATTGKGGEADAVTFAAERTKVYGRRGKRVILSSPKHDNDLIVRNHRECEDRRVFAGPCPACGLVQPLTWAATRWSTLEGGMQADPSTAPVEPEKRTKLAAAIERSNEAWLECSGCRGQIDLAKAARDPRARWVQEDSSEPGGGRRGYHVTELLHWETTLAQLAAKFLRALNPSQLQGFYNGSLGIAFEAATSSIPAALFAGRAQHAARVVPAWATAVIATADTQLRGWWYMVRAWGLGKKSRLLSWGFADTEADLLGQTLWTEFAVEGSPLMAQACALALDTQGGMERGRDGSRTGDAYRFVLATKGAFALKGDSTYPDRAPTRQSTFKLADATETKEGPLYLVNKNHYADELSRVVKQKDPVLWEECQGAEDPRYTSQMASEHKVMIETEAGRQWRWKKRAQGGANHMFDCARYQCWAAEFLQIETRTEPTWRPAPQTELTDASHQIKRSFGS